MVALCSTLALAPQTRLERSVTRVTFTPCSFIHESQSCYLKIDAPSRNVITGLSWENDRAQTDYRSRSCQPVLYSRTKKKSVNTLSRPTHSSITARKQHRQFTRVSDEACSGLARSILRAVLLRAMVQVVDLSIFVRTDYPIIMFRPRSYH
jgi:hypothetical protein